MLYSINGFKLIWRLMLKPGKLAATALFDGHWSAGSGAKGLDPGTFSPLQCGQWSRCQRPVKNVVTEVLEELTPGLFSMILGLLVNGTTAIELDLDPHSL